jgi:hypothetical protein
MKMPTCATGATAAGFGGSSTGGGGATGVGAGVLGSTFETAASSVFGCFLISSYATEMSGFGATSL